MRSEILSVISLIPSLDLAAEDFVRRRQNSLTKPPGSLGRLEELAVKLGGMQGRDFPGVEQAVVLVAAASNGVASEGVSAYPASVTEAMVRNFVNGGAAINSLATCAGARLVVCDAGVDRTADFPPAVRDLSLARGSRSFLRGKAMSSEDAEELIVRGMQLVDSLVDEGLEILAPGEMGIGNTTTASALSCALLGRFSKAEIMPLVGRGTMVSDTVCQHKADVVEQALALHRPSLVTPLDVLSSVGGFEFALLVGTMIRAASLRIPILLDGFPVTAAALVAARVAPQLGSFMLASHCSEEPGHKILLDELGLAPLLDFNLRLGEGSGAALCLPLLRAACRVYSEMATFSEAEVAEAI